MKRARFLMGFLAVLIPLTLSAQTYTVTDLGTLRGGDSSVGFGLNARGQVAGVSTLPNNAYGHGFLFIKGKLKDLGDLGAGWSDSFQVNASGEVTGYAPIPGGNVRAYIYRKGHMTQLPTLAGGSTQGYSINDHGHITGAADTSNGEVHPYLYLFRNGKLLDLGTLGLHQQSVWNSGNGINNSDEVAGISWTASGAIQGFLWKKGKMIDLGDLGGGYSRAWAINDHEQIVGESSVANGNTDAFLWAKGKMKDLGTLGGTLGRALAINNSGVAVGDSYRNDGTDVAFVYRKGKMLDLNQLIPANSGWVLETAEGVNDAGQISGTGTFNGAERGFLLTPR